MSTKITVNGRTYQSVDEMPPDARAQYERAMSMLADRDGNGVPDAFEGKGPDTLTAGVGKGTVSVTTTMRRFVINGKNYDRWEDIPEDLRIKIPIPHDVPALAALPDDPQAGGVSIRLTLPKLSTILLAAAVIAVLLMWLWRR